MAIKGLLKPKGGLIASLLRVRNVDTQALEAVGLPTPKAKGYKAARGLPDVTWPHYEKGARVKLVVPANQPAWRYIAKPGMTGTVTGLAQGQGPDNYPVEDIYQVTLDQPLKSGRQVAYVQYNELESAE